MYCTEFIFDGISSREYDLLLCSFDSSTSGPITAGSKIEYSTFKAPGSHQWVKTGSIYSEQLTFTFQVCKYEPGAGDNRPFTERELAFLMRWLVRREYKYLSFVQMGYEDIHYRCQLSLEKYEINGQCYGLTLTALCDAPFGWSGPIHTHISSSGSASAKLYDSSDEIGILFPSVEILSRSGSPESPQNIVICNAMTGAKTQIRNCVAGEQITLRNMVIHSSEQTGKHPTLPDDFNWEWFSIGNTFNNRVNEITITGDCDIDLTWRAPRKAVI